MSDKGTIIRPVEGHNFTTFVSGLEVVRNESRFNDANRYFTGLDSKTQTTIIFTFDSGEKIEGDVFSFSASLLKLIADKSDDDDKKVIKGKITNFTVGIPDIVMQQLD